MRYISNGCTGLFTTKHNALPPILSVQRHCTICVLPITASPQALELLLSELLKLKKNVLISHPSGSESFGTIPEMHKFGLPGGEIYLRMGEHFRDNSGFGVRHIWEAHKTDLAKYGCLTIEKVAEHIASMIVNKAPIYCEFREIRGNHRLAVMKTPAGLLILEPRQERRGFGYYVVTWYPKRRASGTLVGQVVKAFIPELTQPLSQPPETGSLQVP